MQHLIRTSVKILKDPNSKRATKSRTMVKSSGNTSRQTSVAGPVEVMRYFQPPFNGSSLLGGIRGVLQEDGTGRLQGQGRESCLQKKGWQAGEGAAGSEEEENK